MDDDDGHDDDDTDDDDDDDDDNDDDDDDSDAVKVFDLLGEEKLPCTLRADSNGNMQVILKHCQRLMSTVQSQRKQHHTL